MDKVLDAAESELVGKRAIESYLFCQRIMREHAEAIEHCLDSWIVDRRLDFGWSFIHTAMFPGQSVPIMISIIENILFTIMDWPGPWLGVFNTKSTPRFLREDIIDFKKKIIVHLEMPVVTSLLLPRNH